MDKELKMQLSQVQKETEEKIKTLEMEHKKETQSLI